MVESQLDNLLKQFEPYFKCPLKADENQCCAIRLSNGVELQIELNRYGMILIGCQLGQIIGRYQDLLFKEALKANNLQHPSTGILGYSRKTSQLIIFKIVDPLSIKTDAINKIFDPFLVKAKLWHEAIKNNQLPIFSEGKKTASTAKIFGL